MISAVGLIRMIHCSLRSMARGPITRRSFLREAFPRAKCSSARKRTLVHLRAETLRAEKTDALSDPIPTYSTSSVTSWPRCINIRYKQTTRLLVRHMCVNNVPRVVTRKRNGRESNYDLWISSPTPWPLHHQATQHVTQVKICVKSWNKLTIIKDFAKRPISATWYSTNTCFFTTQRTACAREILSCSFLCSFFNTCMPKSDDSQPISLQNLVYVDRMSRDPVTMYVTAARQQHLFSVSKWVLWSYVSWTRTCRLYQ